MYSFPCVEPLDPFFQLIQPDTLLFPCLLLADVPRVNASGNVGGILMWLSQMVPALFLPI
jgi:hypothetical protein